jgi:hypothetical protein
VGAGKSFLSRQTEAADHRIAPKTAAVIFETCKAFFRWAARDAYIPSNPAEGISVDQPKRARGEKPRRPFTAGELESIFRAPVFTGCQSPRRRSHVGRNVYRDAYYWIPLVGYYIDFASYYSGLSRRLRHQWDDEVFNHTAGEIETIDAAEALSSKKKVLPKLPSNRNPSHIEVLRERNKTLLSNKPWTLGLIDAMGLVDLIGRQKYETKNRAALILLDSNFEIALKEYIVHKKDLFPPHVYTNVKLATLFGQRTNVVKEVQVHAKFSKTLLGKVSHYYDLRNSLIHQRASVLITDEQVEDYRKTIERVLKKLFEVKFPAD